MPPTVGGHYRPNLSNPFNQFPQSHPSHQSTHYPQQQQHYGSNYNSHNYGNHASFPLPQQNQHINIFGSGVQNGAPAPNFNLNPLQDPAGTGLASHAAQMRFAQGNALQQQQQAQQQQAQQSQHQHQSEPGTAAARAGATTRIREVWKHNLDQEMQTIRSLVDMYPFVSMDTEFPGIVARPMGNFPSKADYHYQCLRANVDLLKLIQLGITLWSPQGELPPPHPDTPLDRYAYPNNLVMCPCTWQFNFDFSLEADMYSADSIAMLKKSGVDFDKSAEMGIDPQVFGARLIDSGLVTMDNVTWLSFHSGYDFGYLVKLMYPSPMPSDENEYISRLTLWFRNIYDIKYLFRYAQNRARSGQLSSQATDIIATLGQRSGLQDIADELGCMREGRPHTAGSDAWLTGMVFWMMRQKIFDNEIPPDLVNKIWGLSGVGPPASAASQAAILQPPTQNGATMFHSGMAPSSYRHEGPNTPQTGSNALNSTPGPHNNQSYHSNMQGVPQNPFSNVFYANR